MLVRDPQTLIPHITPFIHTTQLPLQEHIEPVDMLFSPFDARGHELLREALLEHVDGILDDGEVDVGSLEDVVGEIAFEDALPSVVSTG